MASEIMIARYDKDVQLIPITASDWKACAAAIDKIRLISNPAGHLNGVECFCKSIDDWIPVFWIDSGGNGSMRQSGFFRYDESYDKAIEIAAHLNAIIYGEEGSLLFEPHIGVLFDPYEPEEMPSIITLDQLAEHHVYYQEDIPYTIRHLIQTHALDKNIQAQHKIEKTTLYHLKSESKKQKKWWAFWR